MLLAVTELYALTCQLDLDAMNLQIWLSAASKSSMRRTFRRLTLQAVPCTWYDPHL